MFGFKELTERTGGGEDGWTVFRFVRQQKEMRKGHETVEGRGDGWEGTAWTQREISVKASHCVSPCFSERDVNS